jgi:hypothetical protein
VEGNRQSSVVFGERHCLPTSFRDLLNQSLVSVTEILSHCGSRKQGQNAKQAENVFHWWSPYIRQSGGCGVGGRISWPEDKHLSDRKQYCPKNGGDCWPTSAGKLKIRIDFA